MPNNAKVTILGNLTRDPATRTVGANNVVSFSVAVNTMSKKPDGNYDSNFYDVSVWGKQGEYLMQRIQKGTQVWVTGDLELASYTDKEGNPRQTLRVNANDVRVLARAKGDSADTPVASYRPAVVEDNTLPF